MFRFIYSKVGAALGATPTYIFAMIYSLYLDGSRRLSRLFYHQLNRAVVGTHDIRVYARTDKSLLQLL